MKLKATVCEFRDDPPGLAEDWQGLVAHVKNQGSDLVLLPEMPFRQLPLAGLYQPRIPMEHL